MKILTAVIKQQRVSYLIFCSERSILRREVQNKNGVKNKLYFKQRAAFFLSPYFPLERFHHYFMNKQYHAFYFNFKVIVNARPGW